MNEDIFNSKSAYYFLKKRFKFKRNITLGERQNIKEELGKRLTLSELSLLKDDLEGSFESAKAGNTLIAGLAIYATLGNAALTFAINYSIKVQEQLNKTGGNSVDMTTNALTGCLSLLAIGIISMIFAARIHSRVKRTSILYSMVSQVYEEKLIDKTNNVI